MKKRIPLLLLCIFLVISLASCGGNNNDNKPTYNTLEIPNWQNYVITYPSDASATISDAFKTLSDAITEKYGVSLRISDDFMIPGEEAPVGTLEILVGETNRQESVTTRADIKSNDYVIKFEGNRLVIIGGSEATTVEAVNYYVENLLGDNGLLYPDQSYEIRGTYRVDKLTVNGVDISEFQIVRGAGMNISERLLASMIQTEIANACGVVIPLVMPSDSEIEYEILVGDTGRAETSKEAEPGTVNIEQTANKLALYGNGDYSSAYVIKYLINDIIRAIPECDSYDIKFDDIIGLEYTSPMLTGTNLPVALRDYTGAYGTDFADNANVLERFFASVDELPEEISILEPIEAVDFPISMTTEIFVAPDGDDSNPGTIDAPLASIETAAKKLRNKSGGIIWVRGGVYELTSSIDISSLSGTILSPMIISAYEDETPIFTSGKEIPIEEFKDVDYSADAVAERIPESAKSSIAYVNLLELGWTEKEIGTLGGESTPKVYIDSTLQHLARYPNFGEPELYFDHVFDTGSVTSTGSSNLYKGWSNRVLSGEFDDIPGLTFFTDSAGNRNVDWGWSIKMIDLTPCTWVNTGNIWYYGNVFEGWEFGHYNIASFDVVTRKMTSKTGSSYGAKVSSNSPTGHNDYYLYNAIEMLDAPGEWFYDPDTGNFYIYKSENFESATIRYAASSFSLFNISNSNSVVIDGLTIDISGGKGIYVSDSDNVVIERCVLKNTQDVAINIGNQSQNCAVIYNDVSQIGTTMIKVDPGNTHYSALKRDRNIVQNNYCHDPRVKVQGGIVIGGHLSVVSHNYLENCQINFGSSAECIVEYNDLSGGSKDVSDAGLIYLVGYYHHGNHIRYNYLHNWNAPGSGVYFDDLSSGNYAYYNIIDSTNATRSKGINMLYTSSGHYNVFYGNILVGRSSDYINESAMYFADSSHLGYRFTPHTNSLVSNHNSKYSKNEFYKRFPEYEVFMEKMTQHKAERETNGYVRNELEIYLRSPANNIMMNNIIIGCNAPITQALLTLTNSITNKPMESTDLVERNYTTKYPSAVLNDFENGDFSIIPEAIEEVKSVIPDFKALSTEKVGLTYALN